MTDTRTVREWSLAYLCGVHQLDPLRAEHILQDLVDAPDLSHLTWEVPWDCFPPIMELVMVTALDNHVAKMITKAPGRRPTFKV